MVATNRFDAAVFGRAQRNDQAPRCRRLLSPPPRLVDLFPDHEVNAADLDIAAWLLYPGRDQIPRKVRVFIDYLKKPVRRPSAG